MDALKKLRIVIRTAQRHSAWIEKQCGVSGAQLWVMQELLDTPGMRVGELAECLAMHQTTTSNLVDALAKRALVIKTRDQHDQRVVKLMLSAEGKKVLKSAPKPSRGLLPEALRKLEQDHLQQLDSGLQAVLEAIKPEDDTDAMEPLPFTLNAGRTRA
jgi:MarR family transcriptional regulator, organic hydroperoxide resistance regulator